MAETDYKNLSDSRKASDYSVARGLKLTSWLRGCAKGVMLPGWWLVLRQWEHSPRVFVGCVGTLLAIEAIASFLTLRSCDTLRLHSLSVWLTIPGVLGSVLYLLSLSVVLDPLLPLPAFLTALCLVGVWTGACHALEAAYLQEDCKVKDRLAACKQLDLLRDAGLLSGLVIGLVVLYCFDAVGAEYQFLGTGTVMLLCACGSLLVVKLDFHDVSIYMKLDLSRHLDLSDEVRGLNSSALSELSQRDQEHSFLNDSNIDAPRLCGMALALLASASFNLSKSALYLGVPVLLTHAGVAPEMLYLTYALGCGFALVILWGSAKVQSLPLSWDRSLTALSLFISAIVWTAFSRWLDHAISTIAVSMVTVVGLQSSGNLYCLVAGPKDARWYQATLELGKLIGVLTACGWFLSPVSQHGELAFLPVAGLSVLALGLLAAFWQECMPHIEFLKKAKYFFMKQLRYPEEVRLEAARRLWAEELKAPVEVQKTASGQVDYRIKRQVGVWTM